MTNAGLKLPGLTVLYGPGDHEPLVSAMINIDQHLETHDIDAPFIDAAKAMFFDNGFVDHVQHIDRSTILPVIGSDVAGFIADMRYLYRGWIPASLLWLRIDSAPICSDRILVYHVTTLDDLQSLTSHLPNALVISTTLDVRPGSTLGQVVFLHSPHDAAESLAQLRVELGEAVA